MTHFGRARWVASIGVMALFAIVASGPLLESQIPEIRVQVELVNLYVSVTDASGKNVPNLKKESFRVWEDDVQQEIRHFSAEDTPYTIGMVLDRSGSMADVIEDVFQAAVHTLEASKPEDEAFIIVFDHRINLVQEFTSNRRDLERALHGIRAAGQTALYDALYTALNHIRKGRHRKKALMVVTDGADNSSETAFRELLEFARENSAIIHVIGFFGHGHGMRFGSLLTEAPAAEKLNRLAEVTGGKAYFPKTMSECRQACLDTANELRSQYSLGYYPTNRAKDGRWRQIRVEVVGSAPDQGRNLTVRTKAGYYAASGGTG